MARPGLEDDRRPRPAARHLAEIPSLADLRPDFRHRSR